jgi:hypothetical protein
MKLNPIQVQKHLKGVDYPADTDALVEAAKSSKAPDEIVDGLEQLSGTFDTPAAVINGLDESGA